jgi:hypothetical protein
MLGLASPKTHRIKADCRFLGRGWTLLRSALSTFGDTALGAASLEWAGLAGLVAGACWAASAIVKLNVAAQQQQT